MGSADGRRASSSSCVEFDGKVRGSFHRDVVGTVGVDEAEEDAVLVDTMLEARRFIIGGVSGIWKE